MISLSEVNGTYYLDVEKGKVVVSLWGDSPEELMDKAAYDFSQSTLDKIEIELDKFLREKEG